MSDQYLKEELASSFSSLHFFDHDHLWLHNLCFVIGLITVVYYSIRSFLFIRDQIIRPRFLEHELTKPWHYRARYGKRSFAVVTAGSEGIGRAFCLELARLGFRIIVISRSVSKLEKVCLEIDEAACDQAIAEESDPDAYLGTQSSRIFFPEEGQKPKTGFYISFDFSTATAQDYDELYKKIDEIVDQNKISPPPAVHQNQFDGGLPADENQQKIRDFSYRGANSVSILVNNVGINYDHWDYFVNHSVEENVRMLKVNCEPQLRMTHHFYRHKFTKERIAELNYSCGIIDLASISGQIGIPLGATYAATKAFNGHFNRCLALENEGEFKEGNTSVSPNNSSQQQRKAMLSSWLRAHVDFVSVWPGFVASGMTHTDKPTWQIATPSAVAKQALQQLAVVQGRARTPGAPAHFPTAALIEIVPSFLLEWFMLRQNKECAAKGWVAPGIEDRSAIVNNKSSKNQQEEDVVE